MIISLVPNLKAVADLIFGRAGLQTKKGVRKVGAVIF
jgi:hypothetical protein